MSNFFFFLNTPESSEFCWPINSFKNDHKFSITYPSRDHFENNYHVRPHWFISAQTYLTTKTTQILTNVHGHPLHFNFLHVSFICICNNQLVTFNSFSLPKSFFLYICLFATSGPKSKTLLWLFTSIRKFIAFPINISQPPPYSFLIHLNCSSLNSLPQLIALSSVSSIYRSISIHPLDGDQQNNIYQHHQLIDKKTPAINNSTVLVNESLSYLSLLRISSLV